MLKFSLFFIFLISSCNIWAQSVQVNDNKTIYIPPKRSLEYFEDKKGGLDIQNIQQMHFKIYEGSIPDFFITHSTYWIRFRVKNNTRDPHLIVNIDDATLDNTTLYSIDSATGQIDSATVSELIKYQKRFYNSQTQVFDLWVNSGFEKTVYIKVNASEQLLVPIKIGQLTPILENLKNKDLVFCIYIGIILIMVLYNLFLYFTTKESIYFFYVSYVFLVGMSQAMLQGYTFRFLWPSYPGLNNFAGIFIPFLNGIAAAEFIKRFLNLRTISKRLNNGMIIVQLAYLLAFSFCLWGAFQESNLATQFVALSGSLYVLIVLVKLSYNKYRAARILLLAWVLFLCSVIIFVLRNAGVIAYNNITYYALQIGSTIEIALLSIALADKINTYRKEQSLARKEALRVSKENERLVRDQNVILERQVHERTQELEKANSNLNDTLTQLKEAQSKLVESEKMVSLGQLTAGIAHEINNPINFVTSNVKPLELDINDLLNIIEKYEQIDLAGDVPVQLNGIDTFKKQIDIDYIRKEISVLLSGIKDGANRTAEIVSNLKNFARIDETNAKEVDINEGISSTLTLIRNTFPKDFALVTEYGDLQKVECIPGKINQVFMNIITNAVQAIEERQTTHPGMGRLIIKTYQEGDTVKILISDNGIGMDEATYEKIFEPFYTTKPVGKGTGLGMSIVKGIMDTHKGLIEAQSKLGEGTKFVITLPVKFSAHVF